MARALTYALERSPLRWLGLSHVLVAERRDPAPAPVGAGAGGSSRG